MLQSYECYQCRKVSMFTEGEDQSKCPTCGSSRISLLSQERVREGLEHGVYFNIDPKTGKKAKPKK